MGRILWLVGTYLSADFIRKILFSAGIGLASAAFFNTIIGLYLDKAINSYSGLPAAILGLMGLFGFDKALSVIIGALVIRASINAMSISFTKST